MFFSCEEKQILRIMHLILRNIHEYESCYKFRSINFTRSRYIGQLKPLVSMLLLDYNNCQNSYEGNQSQTAMT